MAKWRYEIYYLLLYELNEIGVFASRLCDKWDESKKGQRLKERVQPASSTFFALTVLFVLPEFLLPHFSHGPITQKLFRMVPFHLACMGKIVNITADI